MRLANTYGGHGTKAIIKYRDKHSTTICCCESNNITFGAVTRIRPKQKYRDIYIIAFGTSNVVVLYGITFDAGIGDSHSVVGEWTCVWYLSSPTSFMYRFDIEYLV